MRNSHQGDEGGPGPLSEEQQLSGPGVLIKSPGYFFPSDVASQKRAIKTQVVLEFLTLGFPPGTTRNGTQ